jgi:hypothetical protein
LPLLTRWFIKSTLVYLTVSLLVGVALTAQGAVRLPAVVDALMPVYFHLFMVGWVTQMIFGVAYWMFPRVSKENPRGWEGLGPRDLHHAERRVDRAGGRGAYSRAAPCPGLGGGANPVGRASVDRRVGVRGQHVAARSSPIVPRLSCWFIRASLAYLVAGFTLGALMLTLKAVVRYEGVGLLVTPHVEFLLIGWTVQLTMGVAFWILPRFEGGTSRGAVGYAWLAFVLLNAGVILAGLGPALGDPGFIRLSGRAAEAAAAFAFGLHAWRRIRRASL